MAGAERAQDGGAEPGVEAGLLGIAGGDGGPQGPVFLEGPIDACSIVQATARVESQTGVLSVSQFGCEKKSDAEK